MHRGWDCGRSKVGLWRVSAPHFTHYPLGEGLQTSDVGHLPCYILSEASFRICISILVAHRHLWFPVFRPHPFPLPADSVTTGQVGGFVHCFTLSTHTVLGTATTCSMHKCINPNFFFLSCLFQSAWSLTNTLSARQETTALV